MATFSTVFEFFTKASLQKWETMVNLRAFWYSWLVDLLSWQVNSFDTEEIVLEWENGRFSAIEKKKEINQNEKRINVDTKNFPEFIVFYFE